MHKRTGLFAGMLCLLFLLTGCELSLSSLGLGKVEELLNSDPIICIITTVDQGVLTAQVLSGDHHYDPEDTLYLDCTGISGVSAFRVGDTITFSYDYLTAVTVHGDTPYIIPDSISGAEYIPPATEETEG